MLSWVDRSGVSFEQDYGSVFLLTGNLELMREFSPIWFIKEKRKARVKSRVVYAHELYDEMLKRIISKGRKP